MPTRFSRSAFLKGFAGCAIAAVSGKFLWDYLKPSEKIPCRILGPSRSIGHLIRERRLSGAPLQDVKPAKIVIIGGGIAGLSAAWWLQKQGMEDLVLLELENEVGGNSSSSRNSVSRYPWGAHYVPIANSESTYVRQIFEEFGIIEGFDDSGEPRYNELYMCHEPQERLFKDGAFQEGLVPKKGLQQKDKYQIERFFKRIKEYRARVGSDGRPAFAIPLDLSSRDSDLMLLDRISMTDWLEQEKFDSRPLLWYINYCCRDDYGVNMDKVSAWAGIHYFSGRRGTAANAEQNSVVTWPEGNGFLVDKLKERIGNKILSNCAVYQIADTANGIAISYFESSTQAQKQIVADKVIFAAPRFIYPYLSSNSSGPPHKSTHQSLTYAPWMVANITLSKPPIGAGVATAWDNVSYYGKSLGYVVATHQNISTQKLPTVITFYYPLSDFSPAEARQKLLDADPDEWSKLVVAELEKMHPGIKSKIRSIDLWPWGHGMISPSVGFIWGPERERMQANDGSVYFAHSDMSGISNFEEAQYRGVEAARRVLEAIGAAPAHTSETVVFRRMNVS